MLILIQVVAVLGPPLEDLLDRGPLEHPLAPRPDLRPVGDVDAQELEHPRHGKGEVGQVGDRRPVRQRDVALSRLGQSLF